MIEGALAHDALLRACLAAGDVLPVRYGTGFSGVDALRQALHEESDTYASVLDRIAGAQEFAVRASATRDAPTSPVTLSATSGSSASRRSSPDTHISGRGFLRERRLQRDENARRRRDIQAWAGSFTQSLGRIARETVPGRLGGNRILSLSLLVPRGCESALEACVNAARADAARLAIDIAVTGPLPAYSFAALVEAGASRRSTGLIDA